MCVAVKTSVNSCVLRPSNIWDFPSFFQLLGFWGSWWIMWYRMVSLWNSSSGILDLSVIRIDKKIEKEGYRSWDFPSLYMVLESHDRRHNESNIRGFNRFSWFSWHDVPNQTLDYKLNWAMVEVVLQIIRCTLKSLSSAPLLNLICRQR